MSDMPAELRSGLDTASSGEPSADYTKYELTEADLIKISELEAADTSTDEDWDLRPTRNQNG